MQTVVKAIIHKKEVETCYDIVVMIVKLVLPTQTDDRNKSFQSLKSKHYTIEEERNQKVTVRR